MFRYISLFLALLFPYILSGCATTAPYLIPAEPAENQLFLAENNEGKSKEYFEVGSEGYESLASLKKTDAIEGVGKINDLFLFNLSIANAADRKLFFDPALNLDGTASYNGGEETKLTFYTGKEAYNQVEHRLKSGAWDKVGYGLSLLNMIASHGTANESISQQQALSVAQQNGAKNNIAANIAKIFGENQLQKVSIPSEGTASGIVVLDTKGVKAGYSKMQLAVSVGDDTHNFTFCASREGLYCVE